MVKNGGPEIATRPLDGKSGDILYAAFARLNSPESVRDFVCAHGPLERNSGGEDVATVLSWTSWFREVLQYKQQKWVDGLRAHINDEPLDPLFAEIKPEYHKHGGFTIRIRPMSLLDGLRLQIAQAIAGSGDIATCAECGTLFMTGTESGRRKGAKFCCPAHQKRFNSLARER